MIVLVILVAIGFITLGTIACMMVNHRIKMQEKTDVARQRIDKIRAKVDAIVNKIPSYAGEVRMDEVDKIEELFKAFPNMTVAEATHKLSEELGLVPQPVKEK